MSRVGRRERLWGNRFAPTTRVCVRVRQRLHAGQAAEAKVRVRSANVERPGQRECRDAVQLVMKTFRPTVWAAKTQERFLHVVRKNSGQQVCCPRGFSARGDLYLYLKLLIQRSCH